MEKRSLFSRVFGSKQSTTAPPTATEFHILNGYRSQFTNYDGKFYDSNLGVLTEYDMSKLLGYLEVKVD